MKIRPFSHKYLVSKQIIYGQEAIIQDRIPKKFGTKSAKNTNYNCSIMKSRISFKKIWFDDDVTELEIEVCNGKSLFCNKVYIGFNQIDELIKELTLFRERVHGGLYDVRFGEFGSEYANGGFQARLHFQVPGRLYISTVQQSGFFEFKGSEVASESKMYLTTEPILLDNFLAELKKLSAGSIDEAILECIDKGGYYS